MRDLYESLEPTGRPLIRQDEQLAGRDAPGPSFARYEDCIECGLCVSACPISRLGSALPRAGRAGRGLAHGGRAP